MKSKLLSLLFIPLLILSSCSNSEEDKIEVHEREIQYIDDFYRNYYQIFPISFADSNGDGNGDIRGIIDKFDYIKSLNMTGLWLNPVNPSPTYHKYDVTDYKAIDTTFGTLNDYDELVAKCHSNHMSIILDLVFNHSSSQHPWFIECMNAHINGDTSNKYYNYYNVEYSPSSIKDGYHRYGNSNYIYECRFWSEMPDFNLEGIIDGTNTNLINDFKDIMRFWLIDHNVDGFRLDACTSFFTGDNEKNYQFLNWVKSTAEGIKENTYIIGEVLASSAIYSGYYENTNIDSFFACDNIGTMNNRLYKAIISRGAYKIEGCINKDINSAHGHVPAPVVANHDTCRSYKVDVNSGKLLHALLGLDNGATFEYYGDEIGMNPVGHKDEDLRQPLNWGDKYTCTPVENSTSESGEDKKYPLGSVSEQENNNKSMLNYIRKVYKYRLQNPELARGDAKTIYENEVGNFAVIKREYNKSVVYMALNLSETATETLDLSLLGDVKVVGNLSVGSSPYYEGSNIIMPPLSLLLLH